MSDVYQRLFNADIKIKQLRYEIAALRKTLHNAGVSLEVALDEATKQSALAQEDANYIAGLSSSNAYLNEALSDEQAKSAHLNKHLAKEAEHNAQLRDQVSHLRHFLRELHNDTAVFL